MSFFSLNNIMVFLLAMIMHSNIEEQKTKIADEIDDFFAYYDLIKSNNSKYGHIVGVEKIAGPEARKVLETGRNMALREKTIFPGSCWTYVNEVYNRAGFTNKRYFVFRSNEDGPYADVDMIKPADWLYFVNHSYNNVGHSGIFIHWVNKKKRIALILSYAGQNKRKPGTYKRYKIDNVYFITRPG